MTILLKRPLVGKQVLWGQRSPFGIKQGEVIADIPKGIGAIPALPQRTLACQIRFDRDINNSFDRVIVKVLNPNFPHPIFYGPSWGIVTLIE